MNRYRADKISNMKLNIWNKINDLHPMFRIAIFSVLFMVFIFIIRIIFCDKKDTLRWKYSPLTGVNRTIISKAHPCIMGENGDGVFVSGYPVPVLEGTMTIQPQLIEPFLRKDHCTGPIGSYSWWKDLIKFEQQKIDVVNALSEGHDMAWWNEEIEIDGPINGFMFDSKLHNGFSSDVHIDWRTTWATNTIQSPDLTSSVVEAENLHIEMVKKAFLGEGFPTIQKAVAKKKKEEDEAKQRKDKENKRKAKAIQDAKDKAFSTFTTQNDILKLELSKMRSYLIILDKQCVIIQKEAIAYDTGPKNDPATVWKQLLAVGIVYESDKPNHSRLLRRSQPTKLVENIKQQNNKEAITAILKRTAAAVYAQAGLINNLRWTRARAGVALGAIITAEKSRGWLQKTKWGGGALLKEQIDKLKETKKKTMTLYQNWGKTDDIRYRQVQVPVKNHMDLVDATASAVDNVVPKGPQKGNTKWGSGYKNIYTTLEKQVKSFYYPQVAGGTTKFTEQERILVALKRLQTAAKQAGVERNKTIVIETAAKAKKAKEEEEAKAKKAKAAAEAEAKAKKAKEEEAKAKKAEAHKAWVGERAKFECNCDGGTGAVGWLNGCFEGKGEQSCVKGSCEPGLVERSTEVDVWLGPAPETWTDWSGRRVQYKCVKDIYEGTTGGGSNKVWCDRTITIRRIDNLYGWRRGYGLWFAGLKGCKHKSGYCGGTYDWTAMPAGGYTPRGKPEPFKLICRGEGRGKKYKGDKPFIIDVPKWHLLDWSLAHRGQKDPPAGTKTNDYEPHTSRAGWYRTGRPTWRSRPNAAGNEFDKWVPPGGLGALYDRHDYGGDISKKTPNKFTISANLPGNICPSIYRIKEPRYKEEGAPNGGVGQATRGAFAVWNSEWTMQEAFSIEVGLCQEDAAAASEAAKNLNKKWQSEWKTAYFEWMAWANQPWDAAKLKQDQRKPGGTSAGTLGKKYQYMGPFSGMVPSWMDLGDEWPKYAGWDPANGRRALEQTSQTEADSSTTIPYGKTGVPHHQTPMALSRYNSPAKFQPSPADWNQKKKFVYEGNLKPHPTQPDKFYPKMGPDGEEAVTNRGVVTVGKQGKLGFTNNIDNNFLAEFFSNI